jgi:hypothetical protein
MMTLAILNDRNAAEARNVSQGGACMHIALVRRRVAQCNAAKVTCCRNKEYRHKNSMIILVRENFQEPSENCSGEGMKPLQIYTGYKDDSDDCKLLSVDVQLTSVYAALSIGG